MLLKLKRGIIGAEKRLYRSYLILDKRRVPRLNMFDIIYCLSQNHLYALIAIVYVDPSLAGKCLNQCGKPILWFRQ